MSGRGAWMTGRLYALVALGLALLTACSAQSPDPVTDEAWVEPGLPAYCAAADSGDEGSGDEDFWKLVHASCRIASDGDVAQGEALRQVLEEVSDEAVAHFHRELVRVNRSLLVAADTADAICAPGLGLGDDLGVDYRSWIVAHGQAAYDAVVADPEVLRLFPDAKAGCGLGEPYGAAAYDLYLERTGLGPRKSGLPPIESASG